MFVFGQIKVYGMYLFGEGINSIQHITTERKLILFTTESLQRLSRVKIQNTLHKVLTGLNKFYLSMPVNSLINSFTARNNSKTKCYEVASCSSDCSRQIKSKSVT